MFFFVYGIVNFIELFIDSICGFFSFLNPHWSLQNMFSSKYEFNLLCHNFSKILFNNGSELLGLWLFGLDLSPPIYKAVIHVSFKISGYWPDWIILLKVWARGPVSVSELCFRIFIKNELLLPWTFFRPMMILLPQRKHLVASKLNLCY